MYDILNSSFLHFSISTYFTIILTFCFPIQISKTDQYTIANSFAAVLLTSYKHTACRERRFRKPQNAIMDIEDPIRYTLPKGSSVFASHVSSRY